MIAIVRAALDRPLTFIVMAIVIAAAGIVAIIRTPVDIFPAIRIPVIAVAWAYGGLSPDEMSSRIITPHERGLPTTVNDVEHIESQSLQGMGIIKIFLQPGTDVRTATAQVTSQAQTTLGKMPPGATAPLIINYDASTVPIMQLALSGTGMTDQQLFDLAQNQIKPALTSIPGLATPFPLGGRQRQIQIDIDPVALQSKGLTTRDIGNAIAAQNQINPAGFFKSGLLQYNVKLNNAPSSVEALNNLPIRVTNGATVFMRDIGNVRDGSGPQQNIVHVQGMRSALMTVLKNGSASTLNIIESVKARLPEIAAGLPEAMKVLPVGDQSVFVKAAVEGVVVEGTIAAVLTSLMILLFLGSWRSTVIIALSIPLAILAATALLAGFGQTLNVMTLGGLALSVGILVDDATVTIENINWHLEQGKTVRCAILDGAAQIVTPAFVALLCICIVFVPMFFLPGVAGFLFAPMALSVIFAMIASFVLSRTLVPTLAMFLLKPHSHHVTKPAESPLVRFQHWFERGVERLRAIYLDLLGDALQARRGVMIGYGLIVLLSFGLIPLLGSNFFPSVDSGQIAMHVRLPVGTRIEESAAQFDRIGRTVRQIIPTSELSSVIDNIGLPMSSINAVYSNSGTIGSQDGDMFITLRDDHRPTQDYVEILRRELPQRFPGTTFAFLPADIISQILNFGSPAPIDVQIGGRDTKANRLYAEKLLRRMQTIPGLADARIQQPGGAPQFNVDVDRERIGQFGLTERDVTVNLAGSLAGSAQVDPVVWLNPDNGVTYSVVSQMPERRVDSVTALENIPVSGAGATRPQVLGGLAKISRGTTVPVVSHYDAQTVIDIFASPNRRDLGAVASDVEKVIASMKAELPKGSSVIIRGQYLTMNTAFTGLGLGLIGAVVLIYLLIVVNFQSWVDPLVIITALPAALAGIAWMLFTTGTTLSVPALTGAIMCMGVATANAILVISFAREKYAESGDAMLAALEAGRVRFRPVVMTALAMIIGMLPMAIGLGEGGEQNAPLGRAVIGGLVFATIATLIIVPVFFTLAHRRPRPDAARDADVARNEPVHA